MIRRITLSCIGSCLLTFGCASTTGTTNTVSSPTEKEAPLKGLAANSWTPALHTGIYSFAIRDSAFISVGIDTTHTIATQTTTFVSLVITTRGDSLQLNGKIDSIFHASGQQVIRDTMTTFDQHVMTSSTGHPPVEAAQTNVDCTKKLDPRDARIFEIIPSYPGHPVKVGDKWSDTVSTTSCHGKTALLQVNTREYELLELADWKGHNAAKVRRVVTSTIGQAATTMNAHLNATGLGSGTSTLYLDLSNGILLQSSGQANSKLTVTTSRGAFPFIQTLHTEIESSK